MPKDLLKTFSLVSCQCVLVHGSYICVMCNWVLISGRLYFFFSFLIVSKVPRSCVHVFLTVLNSFVMKVG